MSDVVHIYGSSYETCPACGQKCAYDSARALVENVEFVNLDVERYPVTRSKAKHLRQVAFVFDGNTMTGSSKILKPNRDGRQWLARARR
jgi:hypothetical protein